MIVRDVRRNRAVTVVLVVLMGLSVLLAVASAGTLARLVGASSSLLDRAQAPHVAQLHAGPYDPAQVDAWTATRPEVEHHQAMLLLGIDGADLSFDGVPQTTSIQQNSLVVPNQERDLLLDLDDRPITEVAPGTIVLPVIYAVQQGLEVGDPVVITGPDGFRAELTIAGFARDSIMNAAITSSKRLAVAAADLAEIRAHTGEEEHLVEFWLRDPGAQIAGFSRAYVEAGMPQAGQMVDSATFQMFAMVGDGMVAAMVVLVAVLLLVVAVLCLRFSFLTAVEQDYREIGVLKAIGVPHVGIRRIYLAKYAALAGVSALLGLVGGLALTPVLARDITRYMGSVPSVWTWLAPVLAAALVLAALVLFLMVLLRRFATVSPVTALRAGATGRQARAGRLRLHASRLPVPLRLGVMDVLGRWPTYLLLFLVFAVSTFITIVPISSATTAGAPGFIHYMGTGTVDLRMSLTAGVSAVVAVVLAGLMTALFTRMLLARDAGQVAVQRALGADDAGLRVQYVTRMALVLVLGVVVGTVAALTLGEAVFNLMFEGMYGGMEALGRGTSRIDFAVDPLLTAVLLPAALLTAVTVVTVASARSLSDARISTLTTE
jgi:putative ABC transport system permease protein